MSDQKRDEKSGGQPGGAPEAASAGAPADKPGTPAGATALEVEDVKPRIDYPTVYAFKVIGKQEGGFRVFIQTLFAGILGREVAGEEIAEQSSSGARYLSLTVSVLLESEDQRRAIYAALYAETTGPEPRVKYYL